MENDTAVIREQMEHTRTALTEKVEAIEEKVASVVKEAANAVNQTVHDVTETVESTVNTVSDSVSSVKSALDSTVHTMADSVESVKEALDVSGYIDRYPWVAMGGSVALGYAMGCLLTRSNGHTSSPGWSGASGSYAAPPQQTASSLGATPQQSASAFSDTSMPSAGSSSGGSFLPQSWMPMVDKLKGLAIGTASGVLGEMILNMAPASLKDNLAKMIDETTEKLGGTVLRKDGHSAGTGFGG